MREMLCDVQAGVGGEDAEMVDEPIALGECGVEVIGEGRSVDVMRDGDDAGGKMALMTDAKPTAASEDGRFNDGLGEAVRGGSGADVGQSSAGVIDDRVGGELAVDTGLVGDAADTARRAREAVDGEGDAGRAGGAGGGEADSADVVESGADVGQSGLSLDEIVTGMPSVAANRAEEDEAVTGEDDFGGAGGADEGAAVVATGSRADVGRATVVAQHLCCPSGTDRSSGDSGCVGSVEDERQRHEAVGGGFDGIGAGNCFLGSELRVESQVDMAQAGAKIGGGESGGFTGSERQQDKVASEGGGGSGGADAASCLPGPELQAESRMDVAQAGMTIDDGESGGLVGSERQQGKMAGEGDSGRFGGACCFLGPELRAGSQADVAQADEDGKRMGRLGSASEEQKKTMDSNASVLAQLLAIQEAQARHMGVPRPNGVGLGGMGSKGVGGSADGFCKERRRLAC
jgi:hypothetical protein